MSRGTWAKIRQTNRFYVDTYRRAVGALLVSIILSMVLLGAIYFTYFSRGESDFYATDGITPPKPLTPMAHPNYTQVPLLANDQNDNVSTKAVLH